MRHLPGGEEYLLRPVKAQMCRYESMFDGTLGLADFALMNDFLLMEDDNQAAARRALDSTNGQ